MNGRARMFAALSGGRPDCVPVAPCYPGIYLRRFEWQAYLAAYHDRLAETGAVQLTPEEDCRVRFESKLQALSAWGQPP